MDDTHTSPFLLIVVKFGELAAVRNETDSASLCGGNVTLCIPNTASPAGFDRMKATNFHFPVDLSLTQ